jgi:hypothetical protein
MSLRTSLNPNGEVERGIQVTYLKYKELIQVALA